MAGDVYHHAGCLDFSANCNPLGTPQGVRQAVTDSLDELVNYPQVGYEELKRAIADYEHVEMEQVICGNGAAELIYTLILALKPKNALVFAPTFAEYEQALENLGASVSYYSLEKEQGFQPGEGFFDCLTGQVDVVFLCNPNNPTGLLLERSFLLRVLELCERNHTMLVVDECFLDFVEEPKALFPETGAVLSSESLSFKGVHETVCHGRNPAGIRPVQKSGLSGTDEQGDAALESVRDRPEGRRGGFKRNGLCPPGPGNGVPGAAVAEGSVSKSGDSHL